MIRRDEKGVAHIVALSGGKDSTALALALMEKEPRPYTFVCTPTGDELPEMFAHWRKLSDLLGARIVPVVGGTLKGVCAEEGALPNWRMRFCTRRLKIEPFQAFLIKSAPAVAYIGLRADEIEREGVEYGAQIAGVEHRWPMREWGWGISDVLGFLAERGIEIPKRTDCARCFFQRLDEWWDLWREHPDIYEDAVQQEEAIGHTFRSPSRDSWPASLKELRAEFEKGRVPQRRVGSTLRAATCGVCTR